MPNLNHTDRVNYVTLKINEMNKTPVRTWARALALAALVLSQIPAFAATLTISGTVAASNTLNITPAATATALPITTGGTYTIATVNEKSNNNTGYTVKLTSANAGATSGSTFTLDGADAANTDAPTFTLTYNGTGVTRAANGEATITSASSKTGGAGVDKTLEITLPASTFYNADTYTDTLTITLTAN